MEYIKEVNDVNAKALMTLRSVFSDDVNCFGTSKRVVAKFDEVVKSEVSTNSSEFFHFALNWVAYMANLHKLYFCDARNEYSCRVCNKLYEGLVKEGVLPEGFKCVDRRVRIIVGGEHRTLMQSETGYVLAALAKYCAKVSSPVLKVMADVAGENSGDNDHIVDFYECMPEI